MGQTWLQKTDVEIDRYTIMFNNIKDNKKVQSNF